MTIVKVFTDDGREVNSFTVDDKTAGTMTWRGLIGLPTKPMGFLGRALSDAATIQAGGDPERPSEKVMRMLSTKKPRKD